MACSPKHSGLWISAAGAGRRRKTVEVFRLVDCEGLTPLLTLLNEATVAKGAASLVAAHREYADEETRLQIAQKPPLALAPVHAKDAT